MSSFSKAMLVGVFCHAVNIDAIEHASFLFLLRNQVNARGPPVPRREVFTEGGSGCNASTD